MSPRLSRRRLVAFSVVATLLALFAVEAVLRLAGVPAAPERTTTWFPDHVLSPPLWTQVEGLGTRWMRAGQAHHFHPFVPERLPGQLRIAVLGGSATHGYGMLEPGAFPHRLEQLLEEALPERDVVVVNLGTIAWSSQQLLWASRSLRDAGPWDALIVYAGHNELLELASWKSFLRPWAHRRQVLTLLARQALGELRLYAALERLVAPGSFDALGSHEDPAEPVPSGYGADGEPIWGGEEERDPNLVPDLDPVSPNPAQRLDDLKAVPAEQRARMGWLEALYARRTYRHNVGRIVARARAQGTPVLLANPAPNDYQDPSWFPWPGEDGARYNALVARAEAALGDDGEDPIPLLEQALQEHPHDPRALFAYGRALSGRDPERARSALIEARTRAEYPNRVVPAVSAAIRSFDGAPGILGVVDVEAAFRALSPDGIIDYGLIYDHCHPSAEGNLVLATLLAAPLTALPGFAESAGFDRDAWLARRRAELASRVAPEPRLWEWTGLSWGGAYGWDTLYMGDAAGDWRGLSLSLRRRAQAPDATALDQVWAGNAVFLDYEVPDALAAFDDAARQDPTLCVASANAAYALKLVGLRDEAARRADEAARCDPDDPELAALRRRLQALRALAP